MKVAIYCRLSEEDRNKQKKSDDSNSIQNQKAMLIQYAMCQEWELYDVYSDDDYTGADRNRPQFGRLLADAQARKFDIILCKTQSRFTRELELVEKYIHGLFPIWGIRFVSIVDNADTANKGNKKSRQINGLVNEWYLEDMSENIRSVLTSRRENGFHIGAFAPYGYRKDPERKGHLLIDEEAASIVREIFTMFADGYGKTAIARSLNDRGIPNPSEYKRRNGFLYQPSKKPTSTLWKYASIAEILNNEVYIGNLVQGRYESVSYKTKELRARPKSAWILVRHTHEPIIDDALWDQVRKKVRSRTRPFETGRIHPFSGKVICMNCGCSVRMHKAHGHHYLQCDTRSISREACPGAFIPAAELEQIVLRELKRLSNVLLDREKLEENVEFAPILNTRKEEIVSEQKAYEQKIGEYSKAMKQLYLDKVKGILSEMDFTDMSSTFLAEKKRLEEMAAGCRENLAEIEDRIRIGTNRAALVDRYLNTDHLTGTMTEALIDHIEIGRRNLETGQVPVSVFWNF